MGSLHEIGVKPITQSGKAVQSEYALSKYVVQQMINENNNESPS